MILYSKFIVKRIILRRYEEFLFKKDFCVGFENRSKNVHLAWALKNKFAWSEKWQFSNKGILRRHERLRFLSWPACPLGDHMISVWFWTISLDLKKKKYFNNVFDKIIKLIKKIIIIIFSLGLVRMECQCSTFLLCFGVGGDCLFSANVSFWALSVTLVLVLNHQKSFFLDLVRPIEIREKKIIWE